MESTRVIVTTSGFWEHVLGYGVLGLLAVLAFAGRWVWLVLAVVLAVSVGFEVVQVLFLERTFNWGDVIANGTGLGVGFLCGWIGVKVVLSG
jgi:glycopeptide antibiotics resistance protein